MASSARTAVSSGGGSTAAGAAAATPVGSVKTRARRWPSVGPPTTGSRCSSPDSCGVSFQKPM